MIGLVRCVHRLKKKSEKFSFEELLFVNVVELLLLWRWIQGEPEFIFKKIQTQIQEEFVFD